ncbi:DUF368 domain-containing protein [Marinicella gelatinilytica]|uniref:DUF368 domain-containing protein n=1 Tax=Marinicella gelatinilytica TaxID=2996017 RepID=UPI002260CD8F|nr:DUF368 domain-containing protein [Marinicella gelatinilytica]MCX7545044.1 DUF368 domain-containing protein [Marinicella gelatinilytica]
MTYLWVYLKGMLMGMADVVPGVSGGTLALVTGVYERLVSAIARVDGDFFGYLFKLKIKQAWRHVDGWFLLALLVGIISAIFLFAGLLSQLLVTQPVLTWSFFLGLIVAAAVLLVAAEHAKSWLHWLGLLFGIVVGYVLSTQSLLTLPDGHLGIFLAGMIAICAMILPGISGSLILVLLGQYAVLLHAADQREWLTLIVFAIGALLGLLLFSRVLKWLLKHYHVAMIYFLSGLMLGTLFKVWPWKTVSGVNVWPWQHATPHYLMSGLMIFAGVIVVTGLFYWGRQTRRA